MLKTPLCFAWNQAINGYSAEGLERKNQFHRQSKLFLKNLAAELGLSRGQYAISSNPGGIAVSGEIVLHTDHLYIQLFESCVGSNGIRILFRACNGRKDVTGGMNNYVTAESLINSENLDRWLNKLMGMQNAAAKERRAA